MPKQENLEENTEHSSRKAWGKFWNVIEKCGKCLKDERNP